MGVRDAGALFDSSVQRLATPTFGHVRASERMALPVGWMNGAAAEEEGFDERQ